MKSLLVVRRPRRLEIVLLLACCMAHEACFQGEGPSEAPPGEVARCVIPADEPTHGNWCRLAGELRTSCRDEAGILDEDHYRQALARMDWLRTCGSIEEDCSGALDPDGCKRRNALAHFDRAACYDSDPLAEGAGPAFRLRNDHPRVALTGRDRDQPWRQTEFWTSAAAARTYMQQVLDYVIVDLDEHDFDLHADAEQQDGDEWYHTPWMHYGPYGREPAHGLTPERPSAPYELHRSQPDQEHTWAISFYNHEGGRALGEVFAAGNEHAPDTEQVAFPDWTVSAKLLFSTASPSRGVPWLREAKSWTADIERDCQRYEVRLTQLDIAIRDPRVTSLARDADEPSTDWVFGTFIHWNPPESAKPQGLAWHRYLEPVGLMWGNDFWLAPGVPGESEKARPEDLRQAWLDPAMAQRFAGDLAPSRPYLGYRGRLNGPIDNPTSSCLACHARAMDNALESSPEFAAKFETVEGTYAHYHRPVAPDALFCEPDVEGACETRRPLDYSLQLAFAMANFNHWNAGRLQQVIARFPGCLGRDLEMADHLYGSLHGRSGPCDPGVQARSSNIFAPLPGDYPTPESVCILPRPARDRCDDGTSSIASYSEGLVPAFEVGGHPAQLMALEIEYDARIIGRLTQGELASPEHVRRVMTDARARVVSMQRPAVAWQSLSAMPDPDPEDAPVLVRLLNEAGDEVEAVSLGDLGELVARDPDLRRAPTLALPSRSRDDAFHGVRRIVIRQEGAP